MWNSNTCMMYAKPLFSTLTVIWYTDLKHGIYLLLDTSSSAPFLMMEVLFSDKFGSNCSLFLKSQNNKTTTYCSCNECSVKLSHWALWNHHCLLKIYFHGFHGSRISIPQNLTQINVYWTKLSTHEIMSPRTSDTSIIQEHWPLRM